MADDRAGNHAVGIGRLEEVDAVRFDAVEAVRFDAVEAVSFDFYNTLVYHRQGSGRGAMLMEYFRTQRLESDPWEHQVLYDVFEQHAKAYSPHFSAAEKRSYLVQFTMRLFRRLNVRAPDGAAEDHAANVWSVLGPSSLGVFPEVSEVLQVLRGAGYKIAVLSNWQCGLGNFCSELGFGGLLDHIIASAEVGWAKPNPEIFRDVCRRLGVPPRRVLHVGDSVVDDIEGALGAGMQAVLVRRENGVTSAGTPTIPSLTRLLDMFGLNSVGSVPR